MPRLGDRLQRDRRRPPAPGAEREIDRDARQPGPEGRFSAEAAQSTVRSQERLLGDIVRVLVAPEEPIGEAVDTLAMTHDQLVECRLVALQEPRHEPFVSLLTIRANFHRLL